MASVDKLEYFLKKHRGLIFTMARSFQIPGMDQGDIICYLGELVWEQLRTFDKWKAEGWVDHEITDEDFIKLYLNMATNRLIDKKNRACALKRGFRKSSECPDCHGDGNIGHSQCYRCGGTGLYREIVPLTHVPFEEEEEHGTSTDVESELICQELIQQLKSNLDPASQELLLEMIDPSDRYIELMSKFTSKIRFNKRIAAEVLGRDNLSVKESIKKIREEARDLFDMNDPYIEMSSLAELLGLEYNPEITFESLFCSLSIIARLVLSYLTAPETKFNPKISSLAEYFGWPRSKVIDGLEEIRTSYRNLVSSLEDSSVRRDNFVRCLVETERVARGRVRDWLAKLEGSVN